MWALALAKVNLGVSLKFATFPQPVQSCREPNTREAGVLTPAKADSIDEG